MMLIKKLVNREGGGFGILVQDQDGYEFWINGFKGKYPDDLRVGIDVEIPFTKVEKDGKVYYNYGEKKKKETASKGIQITYTATQTVDGRQHAITASGGVDDITTEIIDAANKWLDTIISKGNKGDDDEQPEMSDM